MSIRKQTMPAQHGSRSATTGRLALDLSEAIGSPKHTTWDQWRREVDAEELLSDPMSSDDFLDQVSSTGSDAVSRKPVQESHHQRTSIARGVHRNSDYNGGDDCWMAVDADSKPEAVSRTESSDHAQSTGTSAPAAAYLVELIHSTHRELLQCAVDQAETRAQCRSMITLLQEQLAAKGASWLSAPNRQHQTRLLAATPLSETPRHLQARVQHAEVATNSEKRSLETLVMRQGLAKVDQGSVGAANRSAATGGAPGLFSPTVSHTHRAVGWECRC